MIGDCFSPFQWGLSRGDRPAAHLGARGGFRRPDGRLARARPGGKAGIKFVLAPKVWITDTIPGRKPFSSTAAATGSFTV